MSISSRPKSMPHQGIWLGGKLLGKNKWLKPKLLFEVKTKKIPRTGNMKSQPLMFNGICFLYHHWAKNQIEKLMKSEPIGIPQIKKPITANQDRAASTRKIIESTSCINLLRWQRILSLRWLINLLPFLTSVITCVVRLTWRIILQLWMTLIPNCASKRRGCKIQNNHDP